TTGTKADPRVIEAVLENQETYIGEADIVGETHLTMYQPLKNSNGDVIGMWLVGPKIAVIDNTIFSLLSILGGIVLAIGIIAVIVSLSFTRAIVRPINSMNDQLKEIANGEGDLT